MTKLVRVLGYVMHMTADSFAMIEFGIVYRKFYYPCFIENFVQADLTNAGFGCGPATLPRGHDTSALGVERTHWS